MLVWAGLFACVTGGGPTAPRDSTSSTPPPTDSGGGTTADTTDYCEVDPMQPTWAADGDPCAILDGLVFASDCGRLGFSGGRWLEAWWGTHEGAVRGGWYDCRAEDGKGIITWCLAGSGYDYGYYSTGYYQWTFDPATAQIDGAYTLIGQGLENDLAPWFPFLAESYGTLDELFGSTSTGCPPPASGY